MSKPTPPDLKNLLDRRLAGGPLRLRESRLLFLFLRSSRRLTGRAGTAWPLEPTHSACEFCLARTVGVTGQLGGGAMNGCWSFVCHARRLSSCVAAVGTVAMIARRVWVPS